MIGSRSVAAWDWRGGEVEEMFSAVGGSFWGAKNILKLDRDDTWTSRKM